MNGATHLLIIFLAEALESTLFKLLYSLLVSLMWSGLYSEASNTNCVYFNCSPEIRLYFFGTFCHCNAIRLPPEQRRSHLFLWQWRGDTLLEHKQWQLCECVQGWLILKVLVSARIVLLFSFVPIQYPFYRIFLFNVLLKLGRYGTYQIPTPSWKVPCRSCR